MGQKKYKAINPYWKATPKECLELLAKNIHRKKKPHFGGEMNQSEKRGRGVKEKKQTNISRWGFYDSVSL